MAMTPERRLPMYEMSEYILDALSAGGRSLADILFLVDCRRRLVPSCGELNAALAELTAAGAIVEVGSREFRRPRTPGPATAFRPLTEAEHAEVVAQYHRRFEAALVEVNRSRPLRGMDGVFNLLYRVTGGRLGIAPEWIGDAEVNSAAMVVFNRVVEAGGSLSPDGPDPLSFNVTGIPEPERQGLRDAIRSALEEHRLPTADLRLRFDDGSVMAIAGDSTTA